MQTQEAANLIQSLEDGIQNFIRNVKYYPKQGLYVPDAQNESGLERFAKGLGIGYQEGAKNLKATESVKRGVEMHTMRAPDPKVPHIPYAYNFFEPIEDTVYAPLGASWRDSINPRDVSIDPTLLHPEYDKTSLIGYGVGRLGSDVIGHGLRKLFWNLNPEDLSGTIAGLRASSTNALKDIGLQPSAGLSNAVRFGTAAGLGIAVGNWDPTNLAQGGRPLGYEAITPGEDPRESTQPVMDLLVSRGLLGRNARLLPWEQFRVEKPDVTYDEYQQYRDYLYNRDPGFLSNVTLGLVKGTPDGIDGESPELRVLGYRVTPEGIVGAGAGAATALAATKYINSVKPLEVVTNAVRSVK